MTYRALLSVASMKAVVVVAPVEAAEKLAMAAAAVVGEAGE